MHIIFWHRRYVPHTPIHAESWLLWVVLGFLALAGGLLVAAKIYVLGW